MTVSNELNMQAQEASGELPEGSPEWRASLPEQLQGAPYFKNADSIDQVLADLNNAAAWQGNSLRMPGPDADAEAISAFQSKVMEKVPGLMATPNTEDPQSMAEIFAKLGKPGAADAYKVPEGIELPAQELGQLKAIALEANMTQGQWDTYLGKLTAARGEASQKAQQEFEAATTALRGEWGAAYDQNIGRVSNLLKTNEQTPQELVTALEAGTLPAHMVRWLHSLAELSAEGSQFQQQTDGREVIMNPAEAMEQLVEVEAKIFAKDMRPSDPAYKGLVDKRNKLILLAYPGSEVGTESMRA